MVAARLETLVGAGVLHEDVVKTPVSGDAGIGEALAQIGSVILGADDDRIIALRVTERRGNLEICIDTCRNHNERRVSTLLWCTIYRTQAT